MESGIIIIFDIFLYIFLFLLLRKTLDHKTIRRQDLLIGIAIMLTLCLFPLWAGDYFHYEENYLDLIKGHTTNIEPIYYFVAKELSFSYFSFRLILWGASFLVVCFLYRRLRLREDLSLFIFFSTSIVTFAYARVSIAMTFLFFGFSLIVYPARRNLLSYFVGAVLMAVSYFFHQSALFGIILCVISLLLYNMTKKRMVLLAFFSIMAFFFLQGRVEDFMMLDTGGDDALRVIDRAQRYGNEDAATSGIGEILGNVLSRTNFYIVIFLYVLTLFKGSYYTLPRRIQCFATSTFLIIVVANFFLLDWGLNTYVFYYRFMNFSIIPMVVFLSYCYVKRIYPRIIKIICLIGIMSSLYTLLYSLFISFV